MRVVPFLAVCAVFAMANVASAFYANIVIDGDFSDWDNVPVAITDDPGDNGNGPDLASLQIANDESNLYLRIVYHSSVNPNQAGQPVTHLAVDNDSDVNTGFDVFSLGLIGSEAGWQNDFPFQQAPGVFNSGSISGGAAAIAPYNTATTSQEYAIPLDATFSAGGDVFPNDTFRLLVYTDPSTTNDIMGPVSYKLSHKIDPAEFAQVFLTNVMAFRVTNSVPQITYSLESAGTPGPTNWVPTGFRTSGNGADLLLFDPTGFSTTKIYRVMAEE